MAKNIIGIDIADFSIEAVVLDKERKGYKVEAYSRVNLVPDIVEDGRILDKEKFKVALKQLFSSAQPKPISKAEDYKVFLSIPESKVFSKILTIPKSVKDKDIKEVAKRRAEEMIPEAFDNLVTDMRILGDKGENKEIFFTAAEKDVIASFVDVFDSMNFEIEGITSEAISSFAGLSDSLEKKVTLLLDIGSRTTIASVFDHSGIRDSININIAGNDIDDALAQKMDIPRSVANERKQSVGLDASANDGEIMLIIQGQLQPLADELKNFINYFQTTYNKKIEQIVLIGGLAQMKGIDKYFGDNLSIPAIVGYSFIDASFLPKPVANTKFVNALGLAKLGYSKSVINFYQKFSREKKEEVSKEPIVPVKTVNEDGEEIVEEEKKKLKIKPLYIIILAILLLAGAGFMFRDKISSFIPGLGQKDAVIDDQEDIVVVLDNYSFDKEIFVATTNETGVDNFISAKEHKVSDVITSRGVEYGYQEITKDIYDLLDTRTLGSLDLESTQEEGFYILPKAVLADIKKISPSEDEYNLGDPLTIDAEFTFFKINEQEVDEYLSGVISAQNIGPLSDWELTKGYEVIKYDVDNKTYNIMVNMDLKRL